MVEGYKWKVETLGIVMRNVIMKIKGLEEACVLKDEKIKSLEEKIKKIKKRFFQILTFFL
jgi:hypothetical protein